MVTRELGRWFRLYDGALDDPKVQVLNDRLFRGWINVLCLANRTQGFIQGDFAALAISLRLPPSKARELIDALVAKKLVDRVDGGFAPHNWNGRQFVSDHSADRMQRHRQRRKAVTSDGDVTATVTPPETDTEADTDSEKIQPSAAPPPATPLDVKKALFTQGLSFLKASCDVSDTRARALLGSWRKDYGDTAVVMALAAAEGNAVSDVIAYTQAVLNGKEKPHARSPLSAHPGGIFAELVGRLEARAQDRAQDDALVPRDADGTPVGGVR